VDHADQGALDAEQRSDDASRIQEP
jgi:hypothetical protein